MHQYHHYDILSTQTLAKDCPQFDFIRPDFIMGSANNPLADNREALLERKLNSDLLVGRTEERTEPAEENIALELYDQELPPFCPTGPDGPKVTLTMAIPLIERYCTALPQDKFTILTPSWYLHREKTNAYLQLPISSPLRILVEGPEMTSRKQAKRAVALETCRLLYEMGELDKNLMPKTRVFEDSKSYKELFPLWEDESPVKVGEKTVYPGTKNMKRQYPHKVCRFPIYMNVGELEINLICNANSFQVSDEQVKMAQKLNTMLFTELLHKLYKNFLVVDQENKEQSYFIVPIVKEENREQLWQLSSCYRLQALLRQSSAENWFLWSQAYRPRYLRCICRNGQLFHRHLPKSNIGKYVVDWTTVEKYPHLPSIKPPNDEQRLALTFDKKSLEQTVIIPWYRGKFAEQNYIVTRVCEDLSAQSSFPTEDYMSYADYFDKKYGLKVLRPNQPLIEVKAISNKLNCLRPRGIVSNSAGKRKRQELQEDFEEHLIPELCMQYTFPAELWLKATALPTILHRITYLLMAEELRQTLSQQIGIGAVILPHGMNR
uniref:(California timema) hypothetical protein n=1 Tax=Timema californicum TaxID=61474 RepID=A0A7R9JEK6_TIMCA|nr:unnamed protein product [Timema californicum]